MSQKNIPIFGRRVFTHGWASVLTLLSPYGANAIRQTIGSPKGVIAYYEPGELPQLHEQRKGALDDVIAANGITVLDAVEWRKTKAGIGEAAYDSEGSSE